MTIQNNSSYNKTLDYFFIFIFFTFIYYYAAYICDDAFFILRSIDNFSRGFGLRHNIAERVQAFSCPLWTLLLIPFYKVFMVDEIAHCIHRSWLILLSLSFLLGLASFFFLRRSAKSALAFWICFALCMASQGFVQYLSSGLETPLTYLLIFFFYLNYLSYDFSAATKRDFLELNLLGALACLNRLDLSLVVAAPLLHVFISFYHAHKRKSIPLLLASWSPLILWTIFSLLYYGFPFPNTFYVKLGLNVSFLTLWKMGFLYLLYCLRTDFLLLTVVALSLFLCLTLHRAKTAQLAMLSALAYILYVFSIGGDFLGYRFVAVSFAVSIVVLLQFLQSCPDKTAVKQVAAFALLLICLSLTLRSSPLRGPDFKPTAQGYPFFHTPSSPQSWYPFERDFPFSQFHSVTKEDIGTLFSKSPAVGVTGGGLRAFVHGPFFHAVEFQALSDPLLARFVTPRITHVFKPAHLSWRVPEEYLESLRTNQNKFTSQALHDFYGDLLLVTRGDLFTLDRLKAMFRLNLIQRKISPGKGMELSTEINKFNHNNLGRGDNFEWEHSKRTYGYD